MGQRSPAGDATDATARPSFQSLLRGDQSTWKIGSSTLLRIAQLSLDPNDPEAIQPLEATLVDEEQMHNVHITYQPAGPVYNAVQVDEQQQQADEQSIPFWKRYQRSACFARVLVIALLVVSLAVTLTNKQDMASVFPSPPPKTSPITGLLPAMTSSTLLSACLCRPFGENGHECHEENSMNIERARSDPLFICVFPANTTEFHSYTMKHLVSLGMIHPESNSTAIVKNASTTAEDGSIQVQLNSIRTLLFLSVSLSTVFSFLDVGSLEVVGSVALEAHGLEDRKLLAKGGSDLENYGPGNINHDVHLRSLVVDVVGNFSLLVNLIEQTSPPSKWPTPSPNQTTSTDSKSNPPLDMNNTTGLLPSVLPTSLPSEVSY